MLRKVLYVCAMFSLVSFSGYADTEFDGCKNCLACDKCPSGCQDCLACSRSDNDGDDHLLNGGDDHLLAHHGEGDHDHDDDQDEDEGEETQTV